MKELLLRYWNTLWKRDPVPLPQTPRALEIAPAPTANTAALEQAVFAAPVKKPVNPRADLADRCYRMAYQIAIESGTPDPEQHQVEAVQAKATAEANAIYRQYSERKNERRLAQLGRLDGDRARRSIDRDRAAIHYAEERRKLARHGDARIAAPIPALLQATATVGLGVSLAPTFHDMFVGLDGLLMWVLGGGCAVGVSVFIVQSIIPTNAATLSPAGGSLLTRYQKQVAMGAYLLGGCLAAIRLTVASTVQDLIWVLALTGVEFCIVRLLEKRAMAAAEEGQLVSEANHNRRLALEEATAAEREVARRQALLDETVAEMEDIETELETDHLLGDRKQLEAIAVNAARSGYFAGVAHNGGELGGVRHQEDQ